MKKIASILVLLGTVLAVVAEPITIPQTFVAGTPAKSAEVNSNFAALAGVIQGMRRMALYQSSVKIGSSLLGNVILLDSGYVAAPVKQKGTSTVFLSRLIDEMYYTSSNCTGAAYVKKSPSIQIANETGWVSALTNKTFYLDAATALTSDAFRSSLDDNNVCAIYKTQAEWGIDCSMNPNLTAASLLPEATLGVDPCFTTPAPLQAYSVQTNSAVVTGVTTTACISSSGKPAVCLPNAELKWE